MIGALVAAKGFSDDDYDALVTKTTLYSAKLFKKVKYDMPVTLA